METTVYGDILFLVNFCMDFQSFFLTAKLLHRRFHGGRAVLFSALGAIYACAALFTGISGFWAFLFDLAVCFLMCVGTFAERGVRFSAVFLPFVLYFGVSFALGGAMSGLSALLSHINLPLGQGSDLSFGAFLLLALAGGISTWLWGRFHRVRVRGKPVALSVEFDGRRAAFSCTVDTGNLLHDPVGGRPVALVSPAGAEKIFPPELLAVANSGDPAGLALLPGRLAGKVRLIPAKTATGRGILFALCPDAATLDTGRGAAGVELLLAPSLNGTEDFEVLLPAELAAG